MTGELATAVAVAAMLAMANLASAALVVIDKRRAVAGSRRIAESTLIGWALLGGFPGGIISMRSMRHKTQKRSFQLKYALAAGTHVAAWGVALVFAQGM
jgi:uncharacterized membrane protein YsdA (DUF1294 family)